MLNRLLRLTHLSLTGVTAFRTPELQQFCRPAPIVCYPIAMSQFLSNSFQEFNAHQQSSFCVYSGHGITALRNHLNSQSAANQGGSDDASTRRGSGSSTSSITVPGGSSPPPVARHLQHIQSSSSSVNRRGSAPALRDRSPLPGLNTAFASSTPNFLSPIPIMPGSYHLSRSARGSRNSSTSSVPEFEERPRPTGPRFPTSPTRPIMGSTQGRIPTTSLAIDRIDAGSRNGSRGANDAGGSSSSPLRWVAGMVGWGGTIGEDDGLPPRGERR